MLSAVCQLSTEEISQETDFIIKKIEIQLKRRFFQLKAYDSAPQLL